MRIPCLPIEYFDYEFLKKVGEKIGKPIRADHNTGTAARGRFARICVEIELTKPLLTMFKLRKRVRHIEYEGLHLVCFDCGIVGHRKEDCTKKKLGTEQTEVPAAGEPEGIAVNEENYSGKVLVRKESSGEIAGEGTFGPWMIAQRKETKFGKNRKGRTDYRANQGVNDGKKSVETRNIRTEGDLETNSRYNALYDLEEEDGGVNGQGDSETSPRNNEALNRDRREKNKEAQNRDRREKNKDIRNKSPIPILNIEGSSQDSMTVQAQNNDVRLGVKQWKEKRDKPNQAAAEDEHVVVRRTDKGQHITRTRVASQDTNIDDYEDITMDEHHNDPPYEADIRDAMMMELEDDNGMFKFHSGLGAEGGAAL